MLVGSDPTARNAVLAAEVGANIATLTHNFQSFSTTIENILYNLTLLYGEEMGQHLSYQLTEILFDKAYTLSSKMLCEKMFQTIIQALDSTLSGGSLSLVLNQTRQGRRLKKSVTASVTDPILQTRAAQFIKAKSTEVTATIMGVLGGEYARVQAEKFANQHFRKGRLAAQIEKALTKLHSQDEEIDKQHSQFQQLIPKEKEIMLYPERAGEREEKRQNEMQKKDDKNRQIKRLEEDLKQKHDNERKETLESCNNIVTKGVYRAVFTAQDLFGALFRTGFQVTSAVYEHASFDNIAVIASATSGYYGMQQLTEALSQRVNFDITKNYSPAELYQFKAAKQKNEGQGSPTIEKMIRFEMKFIGLMSRTVYDFSATLVQNTVYLFHDPDKAYEQTLRLARREKEQREREEKNIPRETLMQQAIERVNCPPQELARLCVAYSIFRQEYTEEEAKALATALPSLDEQKGTSFSRDDYALLTQLFLREKTAPESFNPIKEIRRSKMEFPPPKSTSFPSPP